MQTVIAEDRWHLGQLAAVAIAAAVRTQPVPFSMVFAAAPSQNEALDSLAAIAGLPWAHVTAFHLDEYVGLTVDAPQSFRRYLLDRIIKPAAIPRFEGLRGEALDMAAEISRYSARLQTQYPSVGCIGIGENGHIAFNDPPLAKFDDPALVRHVKLTQDCREQQVHDRTFPDLSSVPTYALTLSIHALMKVPKLFVMVPGKLKARAVRDTLLGDITEACPASILRTHPDARLFLDRDSASLL